MKKYLNCVCGHVYYICSIQLTFPCWSITYLTYNTHICSAEILVGGPKGPSDKVSLYSWICWGLTISLKIYICCGTILEKASPVYIIVNMCLILLISVQVLFFFFFFRFSLLDQSRKWGKQKQCWGEGCWTCSRTLLTPCVCLYFDP